jgi:hypothetical protein
MSSLSKNPRTAAVVATAAALSLLAAGCGSGGSSADLAGATNAGQAQESPSAVPHSACVRAHRSQPKATRQTCRHLRPNAGRAINVDAVQQCMKTDDCPRALVQQVLTDERSFAQCMRSRGVSKWPDPVTDSQGRPIFAISIGRDGFNPYSKRIWAKGNRCSHLMPDLPAAPFEVSP